MNLSTLEPRLSEISSFSLHWNQCSPKLLWLQNKSQNFFNQFIKCIYLKIQFRLSLFLAVNAFEVFHILSELPLTAYCRLLSCKGILFTLYKSLIKHEFNNPAGNVTVCWASKWLIFITEQLICFSTAIIIRQNSILHWENSKAKGSSSTNIWG